MAKSSHLIITHTTKPHGVGPQNLGTFARKMEPGLKSPEHHNPPHTTSSCTAMYTLVVTLLPLLEVVLPQFSSCNIIYMLYNYY